MKTALIVVGAFVAVLLVVVAIGYALPVKHQASREATFAATPDSVFAVITDIDRIPSWRPSVKRVERVTQQAGAVQYREDGSNGAILYAIDESVPPRRLVTRIADRSLPFGGTWTYELSPTPNGGTTLRITEDGEVYNPLFRFMSRYVFGHYGTIDEYVRDLRARIGEPAAG